MKKTLLYFCLLLTLVSCGNEGDKKKTDSFGGKKPTITGNAYEALVVINDNHWKAAVGDSLRHYLMHDIEHLPQPEPIFNLSQTTWAGFNDILKPVRNIILVSIDSAQYSNARCRYFKDRWAQPQAIIQLTAPTAAKAMECISENGNKMAFFLTQSEIDRMTTFYRGYTNHQANDSIKRLMNIKINIPADFLIVRGEKQHFHVCDPKGKVRRDFIIFTDYYQGRPDVSQKAMEHRQDSILRHYMQAKADPNSYGETEYRFGEEPTYVGYKQYCEIRGLWRMKGDFSMGGPIVSRCYIDEANSRIITLMTYLYGPNEKKRNPLRQMEAVMESIEYK